MITWAARKRYWARLKRRLPGYQAGYHAGYRAGDKHGYAKGFEICCDEAAKWEAAHPTPTVGVEAVHDYSQTQAPGTITLAEWKSMDAPVTSPAKLGNFDRLQPDEVREMRQDVEP